MNMLVEEQDICNSKNSSVMIPSPPNPLFPVFLKLEEMEVLLVGGGYVALEKATALLTNSPNTSLTIVAEEFLKVSGRSELLEFVAQYPNVKCIERSFELEDLEGKQLVMVAINRPEVSAHIKALARERRLLCNVADTPKQCDFYLASVVKKGKIKMAISTNGSSPTVAKRIRELLETIIPEEINESLDRLGTIRDQIKGDFEAKVKRLNEVTAVLASESDKEKLWPFRRQVSMPAVLAISFFFLFVGMLISKQFLAEVSFSSGWEYLQTRAQEIHPLFLVFIGIGFLAQWIDGALGMGYGVSTTTALLSLGFPPAVASASMHGSEVAACGVSSLSYRKNGEVNRKLFKALVIPGVIGAALGALFISYVGYVFSFMKPLVAAYCLFLGVLILKKAWGIHEPKKKKKPVKHVSRLGFMGGFLDTIGGGGWGPLVTSNLVSKGRDLRFTIGTAHQAKLFVAIASTTAFFVILGFDHLPIIAGLMIGGAVAAPLSVSVGRKIPPKIGLNAVGIAVVGLSCWNIIRVFL